MKQPVDLKSPGPARYAVIIGVPLLYLCLLFGGVLAGTRGVVLGAPSTDLFHQFLAQREFAAREMASGHFPLWNPHIFSGIPALGNIQFALSYPLNVIYLLLPLAAATNTVIILHLALAAIFMGLWMRRRGVDLPVSLATGLLYLGCGALFPHVYGGHMTMICLLPWAPLMFWAMDGVMDSGDVAPALVGGLALGMMILAGYPQFVYHLGIAALLYTAVRLSKGGQIPRKLLCLSLIPVSGLGLSAFQLAAMWQLRGAALRGGKLSYEYASMFSLPPENVLTLMAPFLYGGSNSYWGKAYLWEMELFVGVTALVMAGVAVSRKDTPLRWALPLLVATLFLLALGKYTPLFRIFFDYLPGFASFRGHSKWGLPASLFLLLLAAQGFQAFIRDPSRPKHLPLILSLLGAGLGLFALTCRPGGTIFSPLPPWWHTLLDTVARSMESYAPPPSFMDPLFQQAAFAMFGKALGMAAGTFILLALLTYLARQKPAAAWLVPVLAVLEIFLFNRAFLATFPVDEARLPRVAAAVADSHDEYRVTVLGMPNSAMSTGALDVWGYDPFVPKRYAEFFAFTQGVPLDTPAVDIPLAKWHPLMSLLRLRYLISPGDNGSFQTVGPYRHLPRALLVPAFRVVTGPPDRLLATLAAPGFDPSREVLLEEEPPFPPQPSPSPGTVRVRTLSPDELLVEADVASPSLLLLTDPYDQGWHAEGGKNAPQASYPVMKADYILQAIPLKAGRHAIRLCYTPPGLSVWGMVSLITAALLAIATPVLFLRRRSRAA